MGNLIDTNSHGRIIKRASEHRTDFNVCVFCGGNPGKSEVFRNEAKRLAQAFVQNGMGLVYGGASVGIMGQVADSVLAAGGKVSGIIPKALFEKEVAHQSLTELRVVTTMHERKKMMFDLSDAFITFPGGFGTLDETFEIITWSQIGIHRKPLIFLNIENYYTPLVEFIDKAVEVGFIKPEHRGLFQVAATVDEAITILKSYKTKQ